MMNQVCDVDRVEVEEGNLYEVMGEDGPLYCYSCCVVARAGGKWYRHSVFSAPGHHTDPDGFAHPNRGANDEARRFADKVERRGRIDLRFWEALPERQSLEARLAEYAAEEELQRRGLLPEPEQNLKHVW